MLSYRDGAFIPRMTQPDSPLPWIDGSYRGTAPQCADCIAGRGRYGPSLRRERPNPLDRYLHEIAPVPTVALKYYYSLHLVIDLACIDALNLGVPIRNWEPMLRMIGKREIPDDGEADLPCPIPKWRLPAVTLDDVYARYTARFGQRPAPRVWIAAPPVEEPDAFDRALEAAIAAGEPILDWLSLETVRRFTPTTICAVHGTALAPAYAIPTSRIDAMVDRQRIAPHSKLLLCEDWDSREFDQIQIPVAYCEKCREVEKALSPGPLASN